MSIEDTAAGIAREPLTGKMITASLRRDPGFLQTLYDFTERWQRTTSLEEVYEAALDTISSALCCSHASILLFDRSGRMRFVAWRGLSQSYREGVDGHSPWQRETRDPQPILIDDVDRSSLDDDVKRIVRREGIRALAFIPLVERGHLLGKFMLYHDAVHHFSDSEVDLALTIGRQLGFSVARALSAQKAAQLAEIVESSDDAIVSKDLNGIIQTWNRGAEGVFGYRADEVIGQSILMLIPPERQHEEPEILARLRRGEKIDHYETVRRRKDGLLVDISLTISPMRNDGGQVVGASKIARDISDRKRAEAALRESERRLQDLFTALPAAIYTTDASGRITFFNEAAVAFSGRRPVIGSDEWCVSWKLYHPDGTPLPHDQCPMAIALREGRAIRNVEAVAERPDGTRVPFIPYPVPLRDTSGAIVGAINMLVDISERKAAEANQRLLFDELNHRVKNNMQMIQSLLESAARRAGSADPRALLRDASRRLSSMLAAQRVLYATKTATHFGVREFISEVCNAVQQAFPPDLEIVIAAEDAELPNDSAMPLALILNELLMNAAKYGARGDRPTIHVHFRQDGDDFLLLVEDGGSGFDFGSLRSHASGLALVQGLARQLRGSFQVSRNPTRCGVRIPRKP